MKVKQEGEIVEISKVFDEATMSYFWNIRLYVDDEPKFHMGKCEVTQ